MWVVCGKGVGEGMVCGWCVVRVWERVWCVGGVW